MYFLIVSGWEFAKFTAPPDALIQEQTLCVLRNVTGVPCPSCGSTRAVKAIASGDVVSGFLMNPLIISVLAVLGVGLLVRAVTAQRIVLAITARGWTLLTIVMVVLFFANWWWVYAAHRAQY